MEDIKLHEENSRLSEIDRKPSQFTCSEKSIEGICCKTREHLHELSDCASIDAEKIHIGGQHRESTNNIIHRSKPTDSHTTEVQSSIGGWNAVVYRPSDANRLGMMRITIELPINEIIKPTVPVHHGGIQTTKTQTESRRESENFEILSMRTTDSKSKHGPPEISRSTLFTSGAMGVEEQLEEVSTPHVVKSYISAMDDLDQMVEGNVDWQKVEELEKTVWKANKDVNCPTLIRNRSFRSYSRILSNALENCKERSKSLTFTANDFYAVNQAKISSMQFEKLARLRLMMSDTNRVICWVEKQVDNLELIETNRITRTEESKTKMYPLSTPLHIREQMTGQIRVLIEMLTMMEDLMGSIKAGDDSYTKKIVMDM